MASESMAAGMEAGYPVSFDVEYPESPHRWLILIRWLLALPHWIVLYVLEILASVALLIALVAILFTRRYPVGLARFVEGWIRYNANTVAYVLSQDRYPPFSWAESDYPPVSLQVRRPEEYHRWLPLVKWLLAIPHYIVLALLSVIGFLAFLWLFFGILVTGQYPRPAFDFLVAVGRWNSRVLAYVFLLVDEYPPFSLK